MRDTELYSFLQPNTKPEFNCTGAHYWKLNTELIGLFWYANGPRGRLYVYGVSVLSPPMFARYPFL
jgi:hypothetical protein